MGVKKILLKSFIIGLIIFGIALMDEWVYVFVNKWEMEVVACFLIILFILIPSILIICYGVISKGEKKEKLLGAIILFFLLFTFSMFGGVFKDLKSGYEIIELSGCQVVRKTSRGKGINSIIMLEGINKNGDFMSIRTDKNVYSLKKKLITNNVKGKYYKNTNIIVDLEIIE